MKGLKEAVYAYYLQCISDKVMHLQKVLDDLKESAKNETKSTAGDKHETALAMLQIEQENTRNQLKAAQEQLAVFNRIDISVQSTIVINGSLVRTDKGYLFLSVAAGKARIMEQDIIAISPQSPLGMKLMGAVANDKIIMNNLVYTIQEIE